MIGELLDLGFLKDRAKAMHGLILSSQVENQSRRGSEPTLSRSRKKNAISLLKKAINRLAKEPRNELCFSHDPVVSSFQSVLEKFYHERRPQELIRVSQGRRSSENVFSESLSPRLKQAVERRFGEAFSKTDIRWVSCWLAEAVMLMDQKHKFVKPAKSPVVISDNARLVIFGDWGSGLPAAVRVSELARSYLLEAGKDDREAHAIHLGDVYYSGTDLEYRDHVLKLWPVSDGEPFGSWMLNGNHDMYSGGYAYFEALQSDRRFINQGGSSQFALQNSNWTFVGLDTAWTDNALTVDQANWAFSQRTNQRGTVFLSHHYYFSGFEKEPLDVPKSFRTALRKQRIEGWIWGHEHRAAFYRERDGVVAGLCLGHAGVPVKAPLSTARAVKGCEYEFTANVKGPGGWWRKFGLAVVDCLPNKLELALYDDGGSLVKRKTIGRL